MAHPSQLPQQQPDLSIPKFFAKLQDPRRAHRRLHRLQDILVIALCAVIAGAQDWQQIVTFGRKRRDWLGGFLGLPNGIPSHDTFERVFDRLKPQAFRACFREWVQAISKATPAPCRSSSASGSSSVTWSFTEMKNNPSPCVCGRGAP